MVFLRYEEAAAWRKTPYQIVKLFRYHKEYNPQKFKQETRKPGREQVEMDDIDIALGGF
jgi:hypothetical protein